MDFDDWQRRIRAAPNEHAVMALVREFVAAIPAESQAALPPACRPAVFADREEVVGYNAELAREELLFQGHADTAALLRQLHRVFNEATTRIVQLAGARLA